MTLEIKHLQTSEAKIDLSHQKDYFAEWQMAELRVSKAEKEIRKLKRALWIADLEESHKMEVEQLLMEIVKLKTDYKEACDRLQTANLIKDEQLAAARHNKYKRCLAMSNLCHWKSAVFIYKKDKNEFYWRWYKRWLKIAEKFKEAK